MAGILLGLRVIDIYNASQQLAVGYSLITVVLIVAGLLALFVGILLHTIRALFLEYARRQW